MQANYSPQLTHFGLLPEPEGRSVSFLTSMVVNSTMLALALIVSMTAKHVIDENKYEQTELIIPQNPPPEKVKLTEPPKLPDPPKPPDVKLEAPKIEMPKPEPKPDLKPIQMEAKVTLPVVKEAKQNVILAPQPKAALTAAMPAQSAQVKPSTAPVHLGQTFGVTPNPNATRPATIAAIGNPYGGMQGPAVAPHGVVGSTGIGNGLKSGSNAGVVGKVASAGIPATATTQTGTTGKVASVAMPAAAQAAAPQVAAPQTPATTQAEVSIPVPTYTDEARQLKIQGAVVLRVTLFANGQIQVHEVVRGLGHGLDEQAKRAVQQGRIIRPATRNGQAIDSTTLITITFQLA